MDLIERAKASKERLAGECGYSGVLGFSTKRSTTAIAVLDGDEIHLARAGTAWEGRDPSSE